MISIIRLISLLAFFGVNIQAGFAQPSEKQKAKNLVDILHDSSFIARIDVMSVELDSRGCFSQHVKLQQEIKGHVPGRDFFSTIPLGVDQSYLLFSNSTASISDPADGCNKQKEKGAWIVDNFMSKEALPIRSILIDGREDEWVELRVVPYSVPSDISVREVQARAVDPKTKDDDLIDLYTLVPLIDVLLSIRN